MLEPSVGCIVHCARSQHLGTSCQAAIVTAVHKSWDPDTPRVSLTVFSPDGTVSISDVPFDDPEEDGAAIHGTWHWPERR